MVKLYINKNIVYLNKSQPDYLNFVNTYLIKYEEVFKVDPLRSSRHKKKFKCETEIRYLYTEDENTIIFSRGLLELIPKDAYEVELNVAEDTLKVPEVSLDKIKKLLPMYDLRPDQVTAVNKCLLCKRGVIQLPTATGKSSIIAATIKQLLETNPKMKTLVLAPTLSTVKNITDTLEESGLEVSVFGKPDKKINSPVTTGLVQTCISDGASEELEKIDAVFYDECVSGRTPIILADGRVVSMKEVYNDPTITEVLSFNIEKNCYEAKKILRKIRQDYNNTFYCVTYIDKLYEKSHVLACTNNHKIWTRNGYKRADELIPYEDEIFIDYQFVRDNPFFKNNNYSFVIGVYKNNGKPSPYKYNLEVEDNHNYFANNVLVSNCHHLQCDTWNTLNSLLPNAEYSIGFSARSIDKDEIFKTDIRDISYNAALIMGSSGKVLMHMDPSYYIEKGIIALPILFRISNNIILDANFDETQWIKLAKVGLQSEDRSTLVSKVADIFSRNKRKILILVSEKHHAFDIGSFLVNKFDNTSFGISFGAGAGYVCDPAHPSFSKEVKYKTVESMKVVDMLDTGEIDILIATSHLDEGVDVKNLDAVILASGGKKDRRIIQRVGRALRKSKSGKYAYIIDFTDTGSRVLSRHSNERFNCYIDDIGIPKQNIFDKVNADTIEEKFKKLEGL